MVITLRGPKLDPKLRVPTVWGTPVLFGLSQNQSWIQLQWLSSRDNCKSGHAWAMTMLILLLRTTGAGAEKGSLSWKHLGTYFLQVCCVSSAEPHPLSSPTLLCPCWGSLCLDLDLPDPDQGSTPWLDLDFPHHHKTCILFPSVLFENQNRHKFHTNVFSGKI